MYRLNMYLPALDRLEKLKNTSYKSELFKATGYLKTKQLKKALVSYKKAYEFNSKDNDNLKEIKLLQARIEIETKYLSLNTDQLKSEYLMSLVAKNREKKPDSAYKYFLQAFEYNKSLSANDDGIISEAIEFYRFHLKDKRIFPRLFLGIFLEIQGDYKTAILRLNECLYRSDLPAIYKEKAQQYLAKAEKIENINKMARLAEKKAAEAERLKKDKLTRNKTKLVNKPSKLTNTKHTGMKTSKKKPKYKEASSPYTPLTEIAKDSPYTKYVQAEVDKLMERLDEAPEQNETYAIIRKLGNCRLQDEAVMAKLLYLLDTDDVAQISCVLESIYKIGPPTAKVAVPYILPLLKKDKRIVQVYAMEALSKINCEPKKVIPAMFNEYKNSRNTYEERLFYRYITSFGAKAIPVLYSMLEDAIGPDKRPIARILSRMTGKSIDDLIDEY